MLKLFGSDLPESKVRRFVFWVGCVKIIASTTVLLGWAWNVDCLTKIVPTWEAMRPLTALSFALIGSSSVVGAVGGRKERASTLWRHAVGFFIALMGIIKLSEYGFGINLGIESILFPHRAPGHVAFLTSVSFVAIGISLQINGTTGRSQRWLERLAMVPMIAAFFGLMDYVVDPAISRTGMAFPTGLLLLLTSATMLAQEARSAIAQLLMSAGPGGVIGRRMLPAIMAVPLIIAGGRWLSERPGVWGPWIGLSVMVLVAVTLPLLIIVRTGRMLNEQEADRRAARQALEDREQKLARSEERYRSLVVATSQVVWVTDANGNRCSEANSWQAFTGQSEEEALGMGWAACVHLEDRSRALTTWNAALHQRILYEAEYRLRRADGEYRHCVARAVPVLTSDGVVREWVGTCTDITEKKQAIDQLHRTSAELERSNRELEQFAYVASHDLQEPLRAVAGCVQILQERYCAALDTKAQELIGHSVEGAARMKTLIHDLLRYSHLNTPVTPLQSVNAQQSFDDSLRNLAQSITESNATITHDSLPSVLGHAAQLSQLFQNLIGNALKYRNHEPPRIHVCARQVGAWHEFSVSDNGIGIEAQYLERIFGLFQRLHTRREYPGTGIGLAICRKTVEWHGGRIWAESAPDRGSTFRFTLPASE